MLINHGDLHHYQMNFDFIFFNTISNVFFFLNFSEKNNKYTDAAKQAGMSVFTGLLAGKNIQQALLDR